jgi:hypothetical protein
LRGRYNRRLVKLSKWADFPQDERITPEVRTQRLFAQRLSTIKNLNATKATTQQPPQIIQNIADTKPLIPLMPNVVPPASSMGAMPQLKTESGIPIGSNVSDTTLIQSNLMATNLSTTTPYQ